MSYRFFALLILIFLVEINCDCEVGWQKFQNKCFKYVPTKVNYKGAIQLCKIYNATLASVHSKEEHVFIEDIARHYSAASGVHWVWLGGQRLKSNRTVDMNTDLKNDILTSVFDASNKFANQSLNNQFKWHDGSPFDYSEWRSNCPDKRPQEDCILMSVFQSRSSHWCNYKCDLNQDHAICQITLPPKNDISTKTNNLSDIKEEKNLTDLVAMEQNMMESSCDFGWTLNDDFCYKYYESNTTWTVANTMCMKNNANLLSINSESEQMFIQNFLFTISGAQEAVWLGAKRKGQEKEFFWIDNSTFIYQNYAAHEPDFRNNREECLAMNNVDEYFGLWLDAPCNVLFSVACKKKAKKAASCQQNVELFNEAQKAIQMNDFIIQLLQRITNRLDEVNQSKTEKESSSKLNDGKENSAVALEIKSEVDSILHNSSLIRLSLHLSIFISFILISLLMIIALFLFKRRHLIKKPYLSIFSFKNLNYEDKNLNCNEYEELLYNQNHNVNLNAASSSSNERNHHLSDKV